MEKHCLETQAPDIEETERFDALFREQQVQMQEDQRRWEDSRKRWRTKIIFLIWIFFVGFFTLGFGILMFPRRPLPDPQIYAQLNPITTPWTVTIFSGGFGFLLKKLCRDKYWTTSNTVAAILGGLFGLLPAVQVRMAELFYLLITPLITIFS